MPQRLPIHEIWTDEVDMAGAVEAADAFVREGSRGHTVFAVNPEKCYSVPANPRLHKMFREADLLIPDGVGIVAAARLLHGANLQRVPGADLMVALCQLAEKRGYPVFLLGSSEEVNLAAVKELKRRYPRLEVAGRRNGYFSQEDEEQVVAQIAASGARILFAAMGSPRQELWWLENRDKLPQVRIFQGIGGTLDTLAGKVKRAPAFWQKNGLEWFYRVASDPRRVPRTLPLARFAFRTLAAWPTARRKKIKGEAQSSPSQKDRSAA